MSDARLILAVDTSTRASIVVRRRRRRRSAVSRREVQHRHGSHVLEQIDEVLAEAGVHARRRGGAGGGHRARLVHRPAGGPGHGQDHRLRARACRWWA